MNGYVWNVKETAVPGNDGDQYLTDLLNRAEHEVFSVVPVEHGKVLIVQRASKRNLHEGGEITWYAKPETKEDAK